MPLKLGWRFVVEAAFLVAVAVVAAMLSLSTPAIIAVMAGAWLAVAVFEWTLSRRAEARRAATVDAATRAAPPAAPHAVPAEPAAPAEAAAEPALDPDVLPEPIPPEPIAELAHAAPAGAPADGASPPLPEPVPPGHARPELTAVPTPEPEAEPEPEVEPEEERPPPPAAVVELDAHRTEPREWNLWELERAARAAAGDDATRAEERSYLLVYLREFAGPDGSLPVNFDALVRDAFGELLGSARR